MLRCSVTAVKISRIDLLAAPVRDRWRPRFSIEVLMTSTSTASIYAGFKNSTYFPSLNGIRAICAILVIKEHAKWAIHGAPQMFEWGFLGVDMFFIISGFLIVTLLLRERDRTGRMDLKQFYIRRTLRIFPIYYLVIGCLFVLAVTTYGHSTKTWDLYKWSFPVFLLYLQDLVPISLGVMFHTWSLSMEEQFYLVWPTVEKYFRKSLIVPLLLILVVFWQVCNFGYLSDALTSIYGGPEGPVRPIFLITFTPILLGVLAAHAMHDPKVGTALASVLKSRWMPPVLLVAAALFCEYSTQLQGITRLMVHVLLCLMLLAIVINPRGLFSRVLQSRVMSYLGSISYGMYLYHTFILWGVGRLCESRGIVLKPFELFLIVTPIAIAVAAVSFKYFEAPIMNTRHRKPEMKAAVATQQGA
jgi:peptidoglycan/LPS O-acetylase OafA/YrhL